MKVDHSAPRALLTGLLLALAACGTPPAQEKEAAANSAAGQAPQAPAAPDSSTPAKAAPADLGQADPATAAARPGPLSCAADIGGAAAAKLAKTCRTVSPATHPPCNVANSCAMMEEEIARSCALFDSGGEPMAGCGPAPGSPQAAAAVVRRYYAALNARDYGTAWAQWGENGVPGQTLTQFEAGFASTRATHVTIGRLSQGDAGAGSIYQPVPVTVDAELLDGTRQRFVGAYVVRRVNDVDGASAAQRRWHIGSAKLRPAK